MIKELEAMCCLLYDKQMFIQMELYVLNTFEQSIGYLTVDSFFQVVLTEDNDEIEVMYMALYICEVALYYKDFVSTKLLIMARAFMALVRSILGCHKTLNLC